MKYAILKSNKLISLTKPILISFCLPSVNFGSGSVIKKRTADISKKEIKNDFIRHIQCKKPDTA